MKKSNAFGHLDGIAKRAYDVKNISKGYGYWVDHYINLCSILFLTKNSPDTLDIWQLRRHSIIKGYSVVAKFDKVTMKTNGKPGIYAPLANVYGFDAYDVPIFANIANPVLGSKSGLVDGKDCVIIWNTPNDRKHGANSILLNTIQRYARMMAELESTFVSIITRSRGVLAAQALNDKAAEGANRLIQNMNDGNPQAVVNPTFSFDSLKFFDFDSQMSYTGFLEARDYLDNCFLKEIGLQTLEEKKEHMITAELEYDSDVLTNNIDLMWMEFKTGIEKVNELFGTNIEPIKNPVLFKEGGEEDERNELPEEPGTDNVQGGDAPEVSGDIQK